MDTHNKDKLIRDIDLKTWKDFKILMALNELKASELLKLLVEFYIEKTRNNKAAK